MHCNMCRLQFNYCKMRHFLIKIFRRKLSGYLVAKGFSPKKFSAVYS